MTDALRIPCPHCRASRNAPCMTPDGHPRPSHAVRVHHAARGWEQLQFDIGDNAMPRMKTATSNAMREKVFPRSGTMRLAMVRVLAMAEDDGATDYELEERLARTHQSVSATRNGLVADGWAEPVVLPDGATRTRWNRFGNPCVVWRLTPAAVRRLEALETSRR